MKPTLSPKQRNLLLVSLSLLFFCLSQKIVAQDFEKNYGTPFDNRFSKVIKDGSNYYVLGSDEPTPGVLPWATVTRLDASGNWQWTLSLDIPSVWHDAVLTPSGDLMLVGSTSPFNDNSESLLARVSPQGGGSFSCLQRFNVLGREAFYRIVLNPVPEDPAFPYYILGGQFQPGGASSITDDVVLLNVDENCNFNWKKSISTENDDEWLRDLEVLPNGDLLMCGNDNFLGKVYKTDNAGIVINGFQIDNQVFRSVSKNAAGGFLAAATNFAGNQAFIYKLDQDLIYQWNAQIPALTSISQIWEAAPDIIYVVGNGFFNSANRDVIIKIDNTDPLLVPTIVWVKYFSAGSNFSRGSAWYLPPGDLAYIDTRILSNGFGGTCSFMSVSDLELNTCLVSAASAQLNFLSPLPDGAPFPPTLVLASPMGVTLDDTHLMYEEDWVCGMPCEVDITVTPINPCGFVQVCAVAMGDGPYDYQWCDGQNTACFNTQLPWGDNTFCVTVTCSDGSIASTTLSYNFSETVPPTITCPPHLQLACDNDLTPATTGTATATDNCDPSPTITFSDMIIGSLPCDALVQRTWVAEDNCGNTSSCVQNINVIDNVPPVLSNCPQSQTVIGTYNANGVCEAQVIVVSPTASDNCDPLVTPINDYNLSGDASDTYPQGTTTVIWTATDDCGNSNTCSFIVTVECEEDCTCGTYTDMTYRPTQGAPNIPVMCNDTLFAQCDGDIPWTLGGDFLCAGNSCPPTTSMMWILTSPTNVVSSGIMTATSGFNFAIPPGNFNEDGFYQLSLQAICGLDTCYCDFVVEVECDDCCTDFEAFCDLLDQKVTISVDDDLCKATLNVGDIGPCDSYLEYVSWGDGTTDSGPFPSGSMPMHNYTGSDTYEICYLAIELDADGFICFEKIVCDSITVVCPCCTDFEAFCDLLDQEVTISVDDDLCKATLNVGDIGPCDSYLEYVSWGDGTTDSGPFPSGSMPMHSYTGSDTYEICYLAIELNTDGFICFEKIVCDSITVVCPCCTDFEAFCDLLDQEVTISVADDLCKATLNVGDIGPCDSYLEYVSWGDGTTDSGPFPSGSMPMHSYTGSDTYEICYLAIELDADGFICFEKIVCDSITVACPCCTDFEAFCDLLDQEVTISVDDDLCKATLNVGDIGPCDSYLEYVSWGDGTTDSGPFPSGSMPMHSYTGSDTYEICYLAIELDTDGFICFEKIVCDSITVVCPCCTDFEAFCDLLDQEVTISVDDDLCKATLNVGDIGPCDSYLEYVSWGDGTTDSGPFPSGSMPMHSYTGSDTYEICYLAIELDADGFICFEKIVCDSIMLDCPCCLDSTAFFAAAPTIPTNGTLGDCFLGFQATGLDDCWQISYLWGDQPAVWDGPYPNNTSVTHLYQNAGLYNVCYRLEEIDADSVVCWEYIQCMDIEVLCPDTCAVPPYEDMVAWWPMDEQDGDVIAVDIIGVSNATPQPGGAIGNPSGPSSVSGKVGNALHFISPGNTHLSVADNPSINFGSGGFSIDAWIKTSPGTQTEPIVDKLGVTNDGYALSVQGTAPHFLTLVLGTGSSVNVLTGPMVNPAEWNFVAVTVAPPNVTFYVKNSLGQTQTTVPIPGGVVSTTNTSRPLLIGASVQNLHWNIMIDELEIFNRALTSTEVNEICSADSLGKCPPPNLGCLCNALVNEVQSGFSIVSLGDGVMEFQPLGDLEDCDEVTWTWGDGTAEGFSVGTAAVQHDYGSSGLLNVCMSVLRTQDETRSCTQSICTGIVGTDHLSADTEFHLFPNPTEGDFILTLTREVPRNGRVQVVDLFGRIVHQGTLPAGATRYVSSVSALPDGVYVVKVLVEESVVWVTKIVKQ